MHSLTHWGVGQCIFKWTVAMRGFVLDSWTFCLFFIFSRASLRSRLVHNEAGGVASSGSLGNKESTFHVLVSVCRCCHVCFDALLVGRVSQRNQLSHFQRVRLEWCSYSKLWFQYEIGHFLDLCINGRSPASGGANMTQARVIFQAHCALADPGFQWGGGAKWKTRIWKVSRSETAVRSMA